MIRVKTRANLPGYNPPLEVDILADFERGAEQPVHLVSVSHWHNGQVIELINGLIGNQAEQLEAAVASSMDPPKA